MFMKSFRCQRPLSAAVLLAAAVLAFVPCQLASAQITVDNLIGKAVTDISDSMAKPVQQAITLFTNRQFNDARLLLKKTREKYPQLPPAGVLMAQMFAAANQGAAARSELERTVLTNPEDPEPYLVFGDRAFNNRQITESSLCFERAQQLLASYDANPKRKRDMQIRAYAGLAAVALARTQHSLAEQYLGKWIEIEPDSTVAYTRLGQAQFRQGGEDAERKAYATFRKLYDEIDTERDPAKKVPRAEVNMAVMYSQDNRLANAKKLMELALQRAEPDDINTRLAVAQWALEVGEIELAKTAAGAAGQIDPDSLQALLLTGVAARYEKDYASAEKAFRGALAIAPSNFAAMNNLALAMIDQPDESKRRQALEYAQLNQRIHNNLQNAAGREAAITMAWILFQMGREADAERAVISVLQSGSVTNEAAYYAAKILSDRGRATEAKRILEPLLQNNRYFPNRDEAEEIFKRLNSQSDLLPQ